MGEGVTDILGGHSLWAPSDRVGHNFETPSDGGIMK